MCGAQRDEALAHAIHSCYAWMGTCGHTRNTPAFVGMRFDDRVVDSGGHPNDCAAAHGGRPTRAGPHQLTERWLSRLAQHPLALAGGFALLGFEAQVDLPSARPHAWAEPVDVVGAVIRELLRLLRHLGRLVPARRG